VVQIVEFGFYHFTSIHTLFVHFETKNPLLCIKAKIFFVNEKKMHTEKNARKWGMMRNAHPQNKNPCIMLLIYKLQVTRPFICCKP
jgi:hypothetical protein